MTGKRKIINSHIERRKGYAWEGSKGNTKNLEAAYSQQRVLTKTKLPPEPAPKDAFETMTEYNKRISAHERQVKEAELENGEALETLKKEENLKLAQAKVAYLGQQIRVLAPFIKRLQDLQDRKCTLRKEGSMRSKYILLIGIVGIMAALFCTQAWAAATNFPTKPIQLWVGFPPGGPVDVDARTLCPGAEKVLGKPLIVGNKPGGGGLLALELLKLAKPDGYTLAFLADTPLTRSPHMMNVKFDTLKDFTFLMRTTMERSTLVVMSDSPFKKFQDMIDFARKNPGQLTIGLSGYGSSRHIALEKLARIENVKFQYVFFTGAAPVLIALLGGHIMVGNMGPTSWLSHYKVGTVKPLLRWEEEPMPGVPNLPSQEELYNLPLPPANAHLIVVPKGVPKPIVDKLVAAFMAGKKSPQYEALAERLSFSNAKILTGDELNKWVESTYDLYGKLIGELGIKAVPEKK